MAEQARDRLAAELRKRGGTSRELARRAGIRDQGYARELLFGLMQAGKARRWKRPGIRAFMWEAAE